MSEAHSGRWGFGGRSAPERTVGVFRGALGEANAIVAMLRSNGIDAVVSGDDADGWYPQVGFAQGYRVLVLVSEEEEALDLIAQAEPLASE